MPRAAPPGARVGAHALVGYPARVLRSILSRVAQVAALATLLTACGETNIHAIHRLRPLYAAHRSAIIAAVHRIPPPGSVRAWVVPESMTPPVFFSEREQNDPRATAEILQLEEVEREIEGERQGRRAHLGLSIRSPLHFCLAWMGPKNPLDPSVHGNRGGLGEECTAAIARPWLILVRTVELRLPESLHMEAFVIDRRIDRVVASLPIDVLGRYERADLGRGPWVAEAERTIQSAFHEAASCELTMQLSRLPGARIQLDRRGCHGAFLDTAVPASLAPLRDAQSPRTQ